MKRSGPAVPHEKKPLQCFSGDLYPEADVPYVGKPGFIFDCPYFVVIKKDQDMTGYTC